jgi:hypothetical protein
MSSKDFSLITAVRLTGCAVMKSPPIRTTEYPAPVHCHDSAGAERNRIRTNKMYPHPAPFHFANEIDVMVWPGEERCFDIT